MIQLNGGRTERRPDLVIYPVQAQGPCGRVHERVPVERAKAQISRTRNKAEGLLQVWVPAHDVEESVCRIGSLVDPETSGAPWAEGSRVGGRSSLDAVTCGKRWKI